MQSFTLTAADVTDILQPLLTLNTPIILVAIDYNWGAPVSGRFDTDFLQIWAAAKTSIATKAVKLLGNYGPKFAWVDTLTFAYVKDCGERQLYLLDNGSGLSTEFVIELQTTDGQVYYDNNGGYGMNYRLIPYRGRFTSAVAGNGAIWKFHDFTSYSLLKRTSEDETVTADFP